MMAVIANSGGSGMIPAPFEAGGNVTALYIDDNPSNLEVMEAIFGMCRMGWTLSTADCGAKGLALARQMLPDLVLLDLQLPDMSGALVLAELRCDPTTGHIPVVILTADASPATSERLLALGADDFVVKPFAVKDLLQRIDLALAAHHVL